MCGIAGIVGIESTTTGEMALRSMLASIVHRGPDEEGTLIDRPVAVGSRRLSIIDLPGGSQPVWNENGTVAAIFNGEIYNFRALRDELQTSGHRFRTLSDTEVIVHAYEAWGDDCVRHLDGMFAFAIVELPAGRKAPPTRVFLARDRLGIKPLYYAIVDGIFCFASEIKAFVASGLVKPSLCANAITSYLLFGAVSEPSTVMHGICALPPGSWLSVDPADPARHMEPTPFWGPHKVTMLASEVDVPPARHVRTLLESAIASHLIADVPVGVFLSSGIDSTTIAALASRAQRGIHTFTVAFPETEFNEAEAARKTAQSLGTNHREVSISAGELLSRLEEALAAFDQPTADGVNTYFVSWAARQAGLKVALSGLGSDELFGGYSSFLATRRLTRLTDVARAMPKPLRSFLERRIVGWKSPALQKTAAAFAEPDGLPHPYLFTRLLFAPPAAASAMHMDPSQWQSAPWSRRLAGAAQQAREMDTFTAVSWLELRSYLLNMLLRDSDAMSMWHSLEVRVPFLDTQLVEYLLSLPESAKYSPNRPKALLIDAVRDLLPAEVIGKPKRTFTFPWEIWLRGKLRERLAASFKEWSPALEPLVDSSFARTVWIDFLERRTTWSRPWSLFVLNEWTKRNIEGRTAVPPEPRRTPVTTA
ncbi:MAG TPA: asparagine synthase (glutamine-hydrolyzing) [Candidatus Acidoferrum sp.]|nr:asparagine synthase (glutamine-hydrolyzing) [Candidatus Acidoferrum sp.]